MINHSKFKLKFLSVITAMYIVFFQLFYYNIKISYAGSYKQASVLENQLMNNQITQTAAYSIAEDDIHPKFKLLIDAVVKDFIAKQENTKLIFRESLTARESYFELVEKYNNAIKFMQSGKTAFEKIELESTIQLFSKAKSILVTIPALYEQFDLLISSLKFLSATFILTGNEELAIDTLNELVKLKPDVQFEKEVFNNSVLDLLEQIKVARSKIVKGSLSLITKPDNCQVFFDGKLIGVSPLRLDKLPSGTHYLRINLPGYISNGEEIQLKSGMETHIKSELKKELQNEELKSIIYKIKDNLEQDNPSIPEAIALGTLFNAKNLVLSLVEESGENLEITYFLYNIPSSKVINTISSEFSKFKRDLAFSIENDMRKLFGKPVLSVTIGKDEKNKMQASNRFMIGASTSCLSSDDCASGEYCDQKTSQCVPKGMLKNPIYKEWWFISLLGTVGLTAVITGLYTLSNGDDDKDYGIIRVSF